MGPKLVHLTQTLREPYAINLTRTLRGPFAPLICVRFLQSNFFQLNFDFYVFVHLSPKKHWFRMGMLKYDTPIAPKLGIS